MRTRDGDAKLLGLSRRLLLRSTPDGAPRLGHELVGVLRPRLRAPEGEGKWRTHRRPRIRIGERYDSGCQAISGMVMPCSNPEHEQRGC